MAKFRLREQPVTENELPSNEPEASTQSARPKFRLRQPSTESENTLIKHAKDITQQAFKGTATGFAGTYGDILDFFGLQPRETLPGEEAVRERERTASDVELAAINEADEILPRYSRLPSGSEVESAIESTTGIGKPKTLGGRFSERAGRFVGGGAAFGSPQVGLAAKAATVGQAAEEMGAPSWLQAALEIGTFIKGSKSKTPLSSKSPEVEKELSKLRKMGYSDEDLTLAKNALEDRKWLKKVSSISPDAEKRFQSALKESESRVENILSDAFPGIREEGVSGLQRVSSELFDSLDDIAKNVVIERPQSFVKNAEKAIDSLKGTLANTPQEKEVIGVLEKAMESAVEGRSADVYTRFYKGLNQIGKWGTPKEREHVFTLIKDAIKQTFRDQGPEGAKVANALEEANKSWMKYLQAKDVTELMEKAVTDEGINFGKLHKILENPSNFKTFSKGVGSEQASNLRQISKSASDISQLEKAIKGGTAKELLGVGKVYAIAKAMVTGDLSALGAYVGVQALGKLSTKMLIDPKLQNLQLKMMNAVKSGSIDSLRVLSQRMEKEIDDLQRSHQGSVKKK